MEYFELGSELNTLNFEPMKYNRFDYPLETNSITWKSKAICLIWKYQIVGSSQIRDLLKEIRKIIYCDYKILKRLGLNML